MVYSFDGDDLASGFKSAFIHFAEGALSDYLFYKDVVYGKLRWGAIEGLTVLELTARGFQTDIVEEIDALRMKHFAAGIRGKTAILVVMKV